MKLKPLPSLKFYHGIYLLVGLLLFISVIASYSLTGELWQPILQGIGGMLVMFFVSKVDYRQLNRHWLLIFFLALLILIYTIVFGRGGGGRSITIAGKTIQTFYFVTVLYLFYLSTVLAILMKESEKTGQPFDKHKIIFQLVIFCVFAGGIAMRNISTAILIATSGFCLFYVAGTSKKLLLIFAIAGILGLGGYIGINAIKDSNKTEEELAEGSKTRGSTGYNRIKYWLTGKSDVEGYGRQMTLAHTAIARSAHLPKPGKGMIKDRMPEGENDFVFSLICEELSVWVGFIILFIYFFIFYNIITIARKAEGNFVKLFSTAIALLFMGQVIVHVGANINLIPATGQTLPFISRGSAALFSTFILFGIFINMGKQVLAGVDPDDDDLIIK